MLGALTVLLAPIAFLLGGAVAVFLFLVLTRG